MYNRNTFNNTCIQEIIEREFLISNDTLRSTSVTYDNVVQSGSSNKVIYYCYMQSNSHITYSQQNTLICGN